MSTERELTLERNLDDARRCHSAKVDEVKRLKHLLADWMVQRTDVTNHVKPWHTNACSG